jgi:flagellar hook protein FlgE
MCIYIHNASKRFFYHWGNTVASIINGLFSGRSGISSHGSAIAIVGDNISNSSTIGFKTSRAEFADLLAGGQSSGRVIGSGSQLNAVSTIMAQGTMEFTSRPLDLAIDGNGFFVVADGAQRFYTRAGNFKVDSAGFIVNQDNLAVLGFPSGGNGALEPININTVSQNSVATTEVVISGNVNASSTVIPAASIPTVSPVGQNTSTTTYKDLSDAAAFSTVVNVFDSLGAQHTVTFFYFRTAANPNTYTVRGYVNSEEVDTTGTARGLPRLISAGATTDISMTFDGTGTRTNAPASGAADMAASIAWNNGSAASAMDISMNPFTSFSAPSNVLSITQDGQGVGSVTSVSIQQNGDIFAILDNGQSSIIGAVGLVDFSNAEGLTRIGKNLLQKSPESGEPIIGRPDTGKLGALQSGSIELSTVDIANEFVKLITLQRGFQASSRIITTINQLLNDIIQLA